MFTRSQPTKLPQRPLRLPYIVAAHKRHQSALIMKEMTSKALYAQTAEGYTPAWTELVDTRRGVWTKFVDRIRKAVNRALSVFRTRHTYPGSNRGEDLVRRALEGNGPRRVRFYEGNPVWVYDQSEPVWSSSEESSPIGRHESVAELSPRSVVSAGWTVAARGAHSAGAR